MSKITNKQVMEEIGKLQACADDRYDEVAQNIANKLYKALEDKDKTIEAISYKREVCYEQINELTSKLDKIRGVVL